MTLLIVSLAPVFIILFYIYFRDKYEREPLGLLIRALLAGVIIVMPVIFVEKFLLVLNPFQGKISSAGYNAFVVAGFTEEFFKFAALYLLIWRNPEFNEKFDGIVYAVFISLGFAAMENILYVSEGGIHVAVTRAITAVPAHALFGVRMGYFFGIAHMYPEIRSRYLRLSFLEPFILHGIYDFMLMSGIHLLLLLFVPYLIYLYINGFKKIKELSDSSIYREDEQEE